jgi:hypothetical protein
VIIVALGESIVAIGTGAGGLRIGGLLAATAPCPTPPPPGDDPADAFELVVPSLPDLGFSGPTQERGWNNHRIAGPGRS